MYKVVNLIWLTGQWAHHPNHPPKRHLGPCSGSAVYIAGLMNVTNIKTHRHTKKEEKATPSVAICRILRLLPQCCDDA